MLDRSSNRSIFWILAAGIILVAVLLVFSDPWNTLTGTGGMPILNKPERVNRIIITGGYDSTMLSHEGTSWLLFGSEPTNRVAVENLLFAASHLTISSITSCREIDLTEEPVIISFYEGRKVLLRYELYQIGGRNLIRLQGSDKCYFVSIPGYESNQLSKIFSPVPGHYHNHQMIGLLPGDIAELDINLPGRSHYIIRQDTAGNYRCFSQSEKEPVPPDSIDDHAIRMLLSYFSDIRFEAYFDSLDASALRRIWSDRLMAQLVIVSQSGEIFRLEIYPLFHDGGRDPDIFRALVIFNDQDHVRIVNYIYLDVLMRGLKHYIQ